MADKWEIALDLEAIETLVYLVEVVKNRDAKPLIDQFAQVFKKDLFEYNLVHETTIDGKRRIRRYFPELEAEGVQELPPHQRRRLAVQPVAHHRSADAGEVHSYLVRATGEGLHLHQ